MSVGGVNMRDAGLRTQAVSVGVEGHGLQECRTSFDVSGASPWTRSDPNGE